MSMSNIHNSSHKCGVHHRHPINHPSTNPGGKGNDRVDPRNTNPHHDILNPQDTVDIKFPPEKPIKDPGFGRPWPPKGDTCFPGPKTYPTPF